MKGCTSGVLKLIDTTCDILRVSYYECHTMSVVVNVSHVVFHVNSDSKIIYSA